MSFSPESIAAAQRFRRTALDAGATATIITGGGRIATIGAPPSQPQGRRQGEPMNTTYADSATGELSDAQDVKLAATEAATALVETVWREVQDSYNVTPLTGLAIAQKIANAVLSGAIKEHAEILGQPFKPQQTRMPGLD